jgi:hypothetical protein
MRVGPSRCELQPGVRVPLDTMTRLRRRVNNAKFGALRAQLGRTYRIDFEYEVKVDQDPTEGDLSESCARSLGAIQPRARVPSNEWGARAATSSSLPETSLRFRV